MILMRKNRRRYEIPFRRQDKPPFKDYRAVIARQRHLGLDSTFLESGNPIDAVAVGRTRKVFQFRELFPAEIYVVVMAFVAIGFRMSKCLLAVMARPAEFSFHVGLFRDFSRIYLEVKFQLSMANPAGVSYSVTPVGESS